MTAMKAADARGRSRTRLSIALFGLAGALIAPTPGGHAQGAAPAPAAAGAGQVITSWEMAPPPYVVWSDRMVPEGKKLAFWMDKEVYDTLDEVGGAYLALRLAELHKLAKPAVEVWCFPEGAAATARRQALPLTVPAAGDEAAIKSQTRGGVVGVALDLNLRSLTTSERHRFAVVLSDAGKEIERAEWPMRLVSATPPPRDRVKVALTLVNPNPATDITAPVFVGVALPRGALQEVANARVLDAAGAEVAAQIDATGRWNRVGSIRWLGVRFTAQHRRGVPETRYALEYGTAVRAAAPPAPLQVTESKAGLTIVTGPLRVLVPKTTGQVIGEVAYDTNGDGQFAADEVVAAGETEGGPYLVDDTGKRYLAVLDAGPEVIVEERGPERAVVRIESWYAAADGGKLCKHITRLRAYRGLARLDLSHGWLMTAQSEEVRFSDIGFAVRVPGAQRIALAGDPDQLLFTDVTSPTVTRYLLQDQWGHYGIHMNYRETHFADPRGRSLVRTRMVAEGAKSEGWGLLANPRAGVAVGCEDFWQNYPKEVSVQSDRLTFHVWPAHGTDRPRPLRADELNSLYWLHEARLLNFVVPPEVVNFPERNWHTTKYFMNLAKLPDAVGTMKTHEIKLVFFPAGKRNADLRQELRAALQPTLAAVDPVAMAGSGVFGALSVRDPVRHPAEERALDASVRNEAQLEELNRAYGMFVFGDGFSGYDFTEHRFDVYRNWRNTHHGCNRTPWVLFFRSGDPFMLRRGLRNARRVMDGGLCHYINPARTPAAGELDGWLVKVVGGMHDYKGYVPWNAGGRVADYNSMTDFMLYLDHYTGDRRGREVALTWWRGVTDWVSPGGSSRSTAGTLAAAVDLYQTTWDRRMLPFIHAEFKGLCTGWDTRRGCFNEWQAYAPWLERYWNLTGSEAAKQTLIRWADAFVEGYGDISSEWGSNGLGVLAAAALATGDEKYLQRGNWLAYHQAVSVGNDPNSMYEGYGFMQGAGISLNNYFQQETPYLLEAANRLRGGTRLPEDSSFAVHPWRQDPKLGHVTEWWFLDETDEKIPLLLRLRGTEMPLHLTVLAPDGQVVAEREVMLEFAHPHGYDTKYGKLQFELAPDGKRGVYHALLSGKTPRFALTAPIASGVKEVYPAKDGAIGIRCGRAAFAVPANSGTYTIEMVAKGTQGPAYVQDERGEMLATGWSALTPDGKVSVGFPFTFDSATRQRLLLLANYGDANTFTVKGKSPPRYYAVSLGRLFDPEVGGGAR